MNKIGIICASDEELEPFLPHIENTTTTDRAMLRFYEGLLNGVQVVALYSGVGKVNAAVAAQILIDIYGVDAIINAGTAGGMDQRIELFDTIISTQVAYHDMEDEILTEFHPWLPSIYFHANKDLLGLAKNICSNLTKIHFGRMITGEKFIEGDVRDSLNDKFSPLSVDMETAGIAHVCHVNGVPFIAIRAITDTATHEGTENFEKNCQQASMNAKDITLCLLAEIRTHIT